MSAYHGPVVDPPYFKNTHIFQSVCPHFAFYYIYMVSLYLKVDKSNKNPSWHQGYFLRLD